MRYNYRIIKKITSLFGVGFMILGSVTASVFTPPILELALLEVDGVQLWNSEPITPVTGMPDDNNAFVSADRFAEGGCTMTTAGEVFCWGGNSNGQLGNGTLDDSDVEVLVEDLTMSVRALATGEKHTCIIYADETVACWGKNKFGQLGNNTTNDSDLPIVTW